jgi:hypothetical protein
MRYFYDTEFIEDGKTIDLISIGVVSDDGREYYAQNEECKFRRADEWVKENVLTHLHYFDAKRFKARIGQYEAPGAYSVWRNRVRMADELIAFCDPEKYGKPELWGYYSAYDHVVLCQIFGKMVFLPKGWPMYTRDIKQLCDSLGNPQLPEQGKGEHDALQDAKWNKSAWEWLTARVKE